ncbi:unnamed protein product [Effrenium voratum]|nr:unnamed protein product [Effrenium voratum]
MCCVRPHGGRILDHQYYFQMHTGSALAWDKVGQAQFTFLTHPEGGGLSPSSSFLDIACGSLRLGRWMIPWLQTGKYGGVDKARRLIEQGYWFELLPEDRRKAPRFAVTEDFDFGLLYKSDAPEVSWAHSLITHLIFADVVTLLTKLRQVVAAGHRFYATFVKQQEIFGELWAIFEFGRLGKWSAKDFCPRGSVFFAASAIRFRVAKRSYFPHASAYGVPSVWWLLSPYKPAMLAIETCTHSAKLCGFFARIEMRKKPGPPQQTSRTVFLCTHAPTQGVLSAWQRSSGKSFVQVVELKIVGAAQVFVACLVRVCAAQDSQDYRPPAKSAANAVVRHLPSDLAHAAAQASWRTLFDSQLWVSVLRSVFGRPTRVERHEIVIFEAI